MEGNTTLLFNPDNPREEPKKFAFDHSYWSLDGFRETDTGLIVPDPNHANGRKFADQSRVYKDLGRGILHNAWEGYNASLFAYGQTGSGKSFSVVGYGGNVGIVPRLCEELFREIERKRADGDKTQYEVRFSMLEIYNEVVRDLLNPTALSKKKGLKVREHPKKGFYAEALTTSLVTNYKEIEAKIDEGTTNRSIASTNMNATSSRAHTIVGITFVQKSFNSGEETAKTSVINLVDLAGSERVSNTGATGDRLKEGAAINQSLSCLGNCIHALAERANGRNARVPYRDSVLTRLLINALGGNSKTVMIAAISPADINYEETLSTLRYADRAKQIKTVASINEDPTEKMIRELREENDKLKKMMDKGAIDIPVGPGISLEETSQLRKKWEEEMKAAMSENEKQMTQLKQTYEEKLREAKIDNAQDESRVKAEEEKKNSPHLSNLNFDPQLSGKIIYVIKPGPNTIGKGEMDIVIYGPSIQEKHAIITLHNHGGITLEKGSDDSRVLRNGEPLTGRVELNHNDRLVFGTTQLYVFINPEVQMNSEIEYPEVTYESAQEELAQKAGINMGRLDDESMETALLNKDLMETLPAIEEANSISEELDKNCKFEIMLVSPQILGKVTGGTEVYVKLRNLENGTEYEWPKDKFLNRMYLMKEMYQNYEAGEEWDLPEEQDPFLEDPEMEVRIGSAQVYLQPLAFMVELKEQLEIVDYKGTEAGIMNVEVCPCSPDGKEYTEQDDMFVDNPNELIGQELHFLFKILGCRGIPARFTDVVCKYRIFLDSEDSVTEMISDTSNPDFNHKKMFSFRPATQQLVDYLKDSHVTIQVWGKQQVRRSVLSKSEGKNTKEMFQSDLVNQANSLMSGFKMNGRVVDPSKQSIIVELLLMKKQQARQQQRLENIRRMIEVAQQMKKRKVPVRLVEDLLMANSPETADELLSQLAQGRDDDDDDVRGSSTCILI